MPIFVLLVRAGVLFDGAFSLSILKEILQLSFKCNSLVAHSTSIIVKTITTVTSITDNVTYQ